MADEIKSILIFEMLGRPAEHLKSTFEQFINKLSEEEGVEILNKKINEPKRLEKTKQELFTTFAETEINFKNLQSLIKILFLYMPSHIEILSPSELRIKNFDIATLTNELVRKLHQYDEIAKRLAIERAILQKQLQQHIQPATEELKGKAEEKTKETGKKIRKKTKKRKKK